MEPINKNNIIEPEPFKIIKKIARESWEGIANEKNIDILREHSERMRKIFGISYDLIFMPKITEKSRYKEINEINEFISTLESLSDYYIKLYGKEEAELLLLGLLEKSDNIEYIINFYNKKLDLINSKLLAINRDIGEMEKEIFLYNSYISKIEKNPIIKFIKKNDIKKIRNKVIKIKRKKELLIKKAKKYENLLPKK